MKAKNFFEVLNSVALKHYSKLSILNVKYGTKANDKIGISSRGDVIGGVFNNIKPIECETNYLLEEIRLKPSKRDYDIVIAGFPLGVKGANTKTPLNIELAIESLRFIQENGVGLYEFQNNFYVSPTFDTNLNLRFKEKGFYINGVISIPKALTPYHGVRTSVFIVSRKETSDIFVGEILTLKDISIFVDNYFNNTKYSLDIESGWINKESFFPGGFEKLNYENIKSRTKSDYLNYKNYQLSQIVKNINKGKSKEQFTELSDAVYIPSIGKSSCVTSIEKLKNKHQNYYQIIIDNNIALNTYIAFFLNSPLGMSLRASHETGFIPSINKASLEKFLIPIPEKSIQNEISSILGRFDIIKKSIDEFGGSIMLNPVSEIEVKSQIDKISEILGTLTASQQIKILINDGESKTVEFKETFSLDIKDRTKQPRLIEASIKTIAAFLNSDGGNLLIGVTDDGEIKGIDEEIELFDKSIDKFLLRFKNNLKTRIGESIYPLIDQRLVKVGGKFVFQITCQPTFESIFVEDNIFYIRTNPATDKLDGKKMLEYIENRKKLSG